MRGPLILLLIVSAGVGAWQGWRDGPLHPGQVHRVALQLAAHFVALIALFIVAWVLGGEL